MITDADFKILSDKVDAINAILGDWTKQYSAEEMFGKPATAGSPAVPSKLLIPANELANGEYPLAIQQRRLNFIADAHDGRIKALEAKPSVVISPPSGSVSVPPPVVGPVGPQGPKGDKGDKGDAGPAGSVSSGGTVITPIAPELPGLGNGFHFKSGLFEGVIFTQDAPDYSMRILSNHKATGFENGTHAIPTLGQQRIDIEQFGIGLSYWPPLKNPDGTDFPANALDKKGGKGLVIVNSAPDGHRAPYVQLYTGLPGQGLQIGVSPKTANVMENPSIQIEPDGTKSIG